MNLSWLNNRRQGAEGKVKRAEAWDIDVVSGHLHVWDGLAIIGGFCMVWMDTLR